MNSEKKATKRIRTSLDITFYFHKRRLIFEGQLVLFIFFKFCFIL
ncbi:hypothetical protein EV06_0396 [Prochlorococcus sp. MIT 0602]|nr:hypothetical protein EV06_0396 [Prochlorococcus sp. MIT 0602]KGG16970.1 hypothetical protein EV07_0398 [Prochlorococcus sp. MIT 0603]